MLRSLTLVFCLVLTGGCSSYPLLIDSADDCLDIIEHAPAVMDSIHDAESAGAAADWFELAGSQLTISGRPLNESYYDERGTLDRVRRDRADRIHVALGRFYYSSLIVGERVPDLDPRFSAAYDNFEESIPFVLRPRYP